VDGDLLDHCGTAEALVRTVSPPVLPGVLRELVDAGVTVGHHAVPERLALVGVCRGGLLLQGVQRLLGATADGMPALDEQAMAEPPSLVRVGLDADGTVRLAGDGPKLTPARAWRAALEGAAADAERAAAAIALAVGPPRRIVLAGRWSGSRGVAELRRRAWGAVGTAVAREPAARGAALLAGCAAGMLDRTLLAY
jgi:hypothetical protein